MIAEKDSNYTIPFIVLTALFFMWGFMTSLNDILIPYFKDVFELTHTRSMLIQTAFFAAYFIGSLFYFLFSSTAGDPINRIGYKNGIIAGLLLSFAGALLFQPAAAYHSYNYFLAALFVLGLGFTLLQIAANPYVSILGKERTASSRLNLSQAFNSVGTVLGPAVGAFLILRYFARHAEEGTADAVRGPYYIFAAVLLLLAMLILLARLPRFFNKEDAVKGFHVLRIPHLILGMVAIFMYVGSEVSIGSIMTGYLGLGEVAGLDKEGAAVFVSIYWFGLMTGRFVGAATLSGIATRIKNLLVIVIPSLFFLIVWIAIGLDKATWYALFMGLNVAAFLLGRFQPAGTLSLFAGVCILLLLITTWTQGSISMWTLIATGLFNSIMWSNIFTLSIRGLGKYTSQGSSLLVLAVLGGAILPLAVGKLADLVGVKYSLVILVLPYAYIAWYGAKGWKLTRKQAVPA